MAADARAGRAARAATIALVVALVSLGARWVLDARLAIPAQDRWVTTDPDGLYHVRRLERVAEEGLPVAAHDPFLSHPDGAAIPWPPYYTRIAWAILAPWTPDEPLARKAFLERAAASLPCAFGVAASLVAALAAGLLAGPLAALLAGLAHALCYGSIAYSRIGVGDHHAFVSLCSGAMLAAASLALARGALERPRAAWAHGALAGALAGLLLGSWVAALVDVAVMEIVLAIAIVAHARRPLPGLAPYGLAFHAAALLVLAPALAASPWRATHPWIVVNLSWFHAAHLAIGALVFVPLFFLGGRERARRRYPSIVAGALAALFALVLAIPAGPGAGLREGFAWASRENRFMATIHESRPLVGRDAWGEGALLAYLGALALAAPLAWALVAWTAWRRRALALLPFAVALPVFLAQALAQRRFADAAALPLAVVLAWALVEAASGRAPLGPIAARAGALPRRVVAPALVALVVLSSWSGTLRPLARALDADERSALTPPVVRSIGMRLALEWVREHTPANAAVLAQWGNGHAIECIAERPTVATNFGTYVGVESFLDALRFLLSEDPAEAEALLEARGVRFVLIESEWPSYASVAIRTAFPERWSRYYDSPLGEPGRVRDAFFDTLGARLLFGGMRAGEGAGVSGLGFLRLVHVSPVPDPAPVLRAWSERMPSVFVYERVEGARVELAAPPGTPLAVEVPLAFAQPGGAWPLAWRAEARADADGRASVRVPYATADFAPGVALAGPARWRAGAASGPLELALRDVLEGKRVELRAR